MIDLRTGRITDIMPGNLSSQLEVQAFAYALQRQVEKLCEAADRTRIFALIQSAPEEILDYLALELRTPCYKMDFPIETKRRLIISTIPYYMKMGTTAMVNSIISAIFGEGRIVEFYERDLLPHHFMVYIKGAAATSRPTVEFREVLEEVKRKSQWIDGTILEFDTIEHTEQIGGNMATVMTTPILEQPDDLKFNTEIRLGGKLGTITTTNVGEAPDTFNFADAIAAGGMVGNVSTTPVPEEPDNLEFSAAVRIGGKMTTVETTPMAEI